MDFREKTIKCNRLVGMAFKRRCGSVFLSRHILWSLDQSVLCVKHVTTRQGAGSAKNRMIPRMIVWFDEAAGFHWCISVIFSYRLVPGDVYSSALVPHITPIIVFPTPRQLRSTGCAERIPHTCPSLPNLPKIAVWSVSSILVSSNG